MIGIIVEIYLRDKEDRNKLKSILTKSRGSCKILCSGGRLPKFGEVYIGLELTGQGLWALRKLFDTYHPLIEVYRLRQLLKGDLPPRLWSLPDDPKDDGYDKMLEVFLNESRV